MASSDTVIRWTSTGGGWRSMVACMGFGNLFRQAGILPDSLAPPSTPSTPSTSSISPISAISTTSGSSWYSTQLFYSPQFYSSTVLSSPDDLASFIHVWMGSYSDLSASISSDPIASTACDLLPVDDNAKSICAIARYYGGDWAALIGDMLEDASVAYGDSGFVGRLATEEERIDPLKETDLIVQTALTPTARIKGEDGAEDKIVYIGPVPEENAQGSELYATPIPAAYVVSSSQSPSSKGWWYGGVELVTYTANTSSSEFNFQDWSNYYLYPPEGGQTLIPNTIGGEMTPFPEPFSSNHSSNGSTNVVQAAATGSALLGSYSGLSPSVYAQTMSLLQNGTQSSSKIEDTVVQTLYNTELFFDLSVCSQWPDHAPCGSTASRFLDGIATDTTALSTTIGNYLASTNATNATLDKLIKVLLTNTNYQWNSTSNLQQILMHYSTTFNANIAPGAFLWLEDYNLQPLHSPQIFQEFMDEDMLNERVVGIEGSNITTVLLEGTTVENTVFGVVEGIKVEILLINVNAPISTIIADPDVIDEATEQMVEMALDIATNTELLARVQSFLDISTTEQNGDQNGDYVDSSGDTALEEELDEILDDLDVEEDVESESVSDSDSTNSSSVVIGCQVRFLGWFLFSLSLVLFESF